MININAANLGKNLSSYLDQAALYNDVVNVNTQNGNVVIMSEEDYRSLKETLYLLSVPGMEERLLEGLNTPIEDCDDFEW